MERQAVIIDFETKLLDGSPSLEFYRQDFRADSCAFMWRKNGEIRTLYCIDEDEIRTALKAIAATGYSFLVCHNYQFEYGVLYHRFPEYRDLLEVDTMRLAQNWDGGGKVFEEFRVSGEMSIEDELDFLTGVSTYKTGMSLQSCASRILDREHHQHKLKYHTLIAERGGEKSDLHLLTAEELKEYNIADVTVTLALYETLIDRFAKLNFDWRKDHFLYISTTKLTALAMTNGVKVDRDIIDRHVSSRAKLIKEAQDAFRTKFQIEIRAVEAILLEREMSKYKSEKKRLEIAADPPRFNPRSTKQKAILFCDILGIVPKFLTQKGAPSFASKFSKQWGEGGDILKKQLTYTLEQKQGENLLLLSEDDGRWHISIKAAGTATNRLSGGNQQ